jgi:predicted Zn-dependent peptidase
LREDNGLTYHSSAETQYYEIAGSFTINAITNENKLIHNGKRKGVLPLIIHVLNDLIKNGITNRELLLIKNYFKGKNVINMEDSDTLSIYNSEYMLLYSDVKEYVPYDKVYDTFYKNITKEDIHMVIQKYLKKINMNICVLSKKIRENTVKHECEKLSL